MSFHWDHNFSKHGRTLAVDCTKGSSWDFPSNFPAHWNDHRPYNMFPIADIARPNLNQHQYPQWGRDNSSYVGNCRSDSTETPAIPKPSYEQWTWWKFFHRADFDIDDVESEPTPPTRHVGDSAWIDEGHWNVHEQSCIVSIDGIFHPISRHDWQEAYYYPSLSPLPSHSIQLHRSHSP